MYHWIRETGLKAQRGHVEEIMATETVLNVSIFAKNHPFTFWRFLSDRHEISKIRKKLSRGILSGYMRANFQPDRYL